MAVKVVDASALAAILFGEPDGEAAAMRFAEAELVAPALLHFELANVCLMKMRRHPQERDKLVAAFGLLARMEIRAVAIDHAEALELGERTGLTAYDASYLWLARQLNADLVTLDRKLDAAWTATFL
ncbi:Ribonuclease VapC [Rhodospirillaceae bacterium LM-1]|nr:Ribonuclease VapC [Rhodospirillaceae bacterium LM-1]